MNKKIVTILTRFLKVVICTNYVKYGKISFNGAKLTKKRNKMLDYCKFFFFLLIEFQSCGRVLADECHKIVSIQLMAVNFV